MSTAIGAQMNVPEDDRDQVSDRQADKNVKRGCAEIDEQRADNELGRGHVFPGQQPGEVASALQFVFGDRAALKLV